jgi:putative ABC transport system permease protein
VDLGQALRVSFAALRLNKVRSALTMLGMVIGIAAVITLTALGNGVQLSITAQLNSLGTNLIFVTPGQAQRRGGVAGPAGSVPTITYDDARAIADSNNVPSALLVSPEVSSFGQIIYQAQNTTGTIAGVTATYSDLHNYNVALGDWINEEQVTGAANVIVLGAGIAQTLFDGANPIGQQVRVNTGSGRSGAFTVIGVGESKGGTGFNNPDTTVYLPLTTVLNKLNRQVAGTGAQTVNLVAVQAVDAEHIQSLQQEVNTLLLQRHHITDPTLADFSITSLDDELKIIQQATGIFTAFLGAVAGISLLVGGIGIMNIMIVSVTERTHEIGIRKAVGARRRDILVQFLVESVLISILGGAGGVLLGMVFAYLGGKIQVNGQPLQTLVTLQSVLLAAGVSAMIGIFFGIYPAMRAARMNPIQALRYE